MLHKTIKMKKALQKDVLAWYANHNDRFTNMLSKEHNEGELAETAAFILGEYKQTNVLTKAVHKELQAATELIRQAREYFEKSRRNCIETYIKMNGSAPDYLVDGFTGILAVYVAYLLAEKKVPGLGKKTIKEWYEAQTY